MVKQEMHLKREISYGCEKWTVRKGNLRSESWLGLQSHANLKMYNSASDDGFGNPFPFSQVVFLDVLWVLPNG